MGRRRYSLNFWDNVEKTDNCWIWHGSIREDGYGRFTPKGQQRLLAHRHAWELTFGPAGPLCVLHTCDNPPCVRPDHLFLGTRKENDDDRHRKGRTPRGEKLPQTKLTWAEVQCILESTDTQESLARRFGCTQSNISYIKSRKSRVAP